MTEIKLRLLKENWIKQKPQIILITIWMKMNRLLKTNLCSMNRNITGKPDGACFGNVLKDVKNTAAGGADGSNKVMTVPPYTRATCYLLSSFQAPHQPWYGEPMFNPVQLGYCFMVGLVGYPISSL